MDVVSIGESMILFTPESKGLMRYASHFSSKVAGAETNTLIGLSRLGHCTGWISRVGRDEFGAALLAAVRAEGVNIDHVKQDSDAPTGIYFKELVNEDIARIYYYRKHSAASRISPGDLQEDYIRKAKYLYLTGITPALSESCEKTVFRSIELAKKSNVKIVFDPNLRRKLWEEEKARKTLLTIAALADIVLPGISEGQFLFDKAGYEDIAEEFLKLGASVVVVKLGERGAYFSTRHEAQLVPGYKVSRVVDPVGAGDGFAAGFLSGLLDGAPIKEAVLKGNAVGAVVTTVNGDIEGLPDRDLLASFIQQGEDVSR
ncbi:sugar kinase [Neobacillus bataviensis]|uniref:sugar kinase n=1 Tax=Neobacillus bataviensis TaxID=220685 RepID=UPI001CBD52FD|nr:sugar kinase [Neobacillus bataviensis]